MSKKNTALSDLLLPITTTDFFKSYWPENPLFIPATAGKLEKIFSLPELQTLEALIRSRSQKVRACLPDFDDEYSSIQLEPKDALKAFNNSMTLVFDQMQNQNDIISGMLDELTVELGLMIGPSQSNLCQARAMVYATPEWCGTRLHFDANANFIIQISGSKKWTLAKNNSVNYPTERFTSGSPEMPQALEKQCHDQLLDSAPDDAVEYMMQPGCVLFVPRGYWHETTTDENSLSLNFTFSQPTWADIFSKSIHALLLNDSEWRKLYQRIKNPMTDNSDVMLQKIQDRLGSVSAKELLTIGGFLPDNSEK
jgi:50S ribosomal protein L16 3-hydroxylase